MPMDGVLLGFVARQLDNTLRDGRVHCYNTSINVDFNWL